jgi:putative thioredoxin
MSLDVTDFQVEVIERSKAIPVLVDFWAEWCGPCRLLGPILERLAEKHAGEWELAKVNTETHQDIALEYGVSGIPNVKLFVDGNVVNEFTGVMPEAAIEQWLQKAIPSESAKRVAEARSLLGQGQPELAEALLNEILAQEPDNKDARLLLANLRVFESPEQTIELLEPFSMGEPQFEIVDALRSFAGLFIKVENPDNLADSPAKPHCLNAVEALRRADFDTALGEFIAALKADRGFNDECSRKACIAIFRYLGEDSDITKKHRREFGTVLYS